MGRLAAACIAGYLVGGCGGDTGPEPPPGSLLFVCPGFDRFCEDWISLIPGETINVNAVLQGPPGSDVQGFPLRWSSSNRWVAMADPDGRVTGLAVGRANITVAAGSLRWVIPVTVNPPRAHFIGTFSGPGPYCNIAPPGTYPWNSITELTYEFMSEDSVSVRELHRVSQQISSYSYLHFHAGYRRSGDSVVVRLANGGGEDRGAFSADTQEIRVLSPRYSCDNAGSPLSFTLIHHVP